MTEMQALVVMANIETKILLIRGQKVMLSVHLAALYEVEPRALMQAVKRNIERFPEDFMFQLSTEEYANLKSQIVAMEKNYDIKFKAIFDAIHQLMTPADPKKKRQIGFAPWEKM